MSSTREKENANIFSFVGGGTPQPFGGFFGSAAKPPLSQAKPFAERDADNLPEGPKALKFESATSAPAAPADVKLAPIDAKSASAAATPAPAFAIAATTPAPAAITATTITATRPKDPSSNKDLIGALTACSKKSEELAQTRVLLEQKAKHAVSLQAALDKSTKVSEERTLELAAKSQQADKLDADLKAVTSKAQRLESDLRVVTSKEQKLDADLKVANSKVQKLERDLRAASSEGLKKDADVKAANEATAQERKRAAKSLAEKDKRLEKLEQELKVAKSKAAEESKRNTAALAKKDSQIQEVKKKLATAEQPKAEPQHGANVAVSSPSGFTTPESRRAEGQSPQFHTPAQDTPRDSRIQCNRWLVMDAPNANPLVSFCVGNRRLRLGKVVHVTHHSCMLHYYSLAEGNSLATGEQQFVPIADEGGWPVFEAIGLDGAGLAAAFDVLLSPARGGGGHLPAEVRKDLEGSFIKNASLSGGLSSIGPIPFQ